MKTIEESRKKVSKFEIILDFQKKKHYNRIRRGDRIVVCAYQLRVWKGW